MLIAIEKTVLHYFPFSSILLYTASTTNMSSVFLESFDSKHQSSIFEKMYSTRYAFGYVIDKLYICEKISNSGLINELFQIFYEDEDVIRIKMTMRVPYAIGMYWTAVRNLHRHKDQILTSSEYWVWNAKTFGDDATKALLQTYTPLRLEPFFIQHLYDGEDPDLCIASIDHHQYRRTLAICLEMFLRRQLMEYSKLFDQYDFDIRSQVRYCDLHLVLPQLYFTSENPDDIRKLEIITTADNTLQRLNQSIELNNVAEAMAKVNETDCEWWTCDEKLPKFRCRPALLNSIDCMQLLFDSSEEVSIDLMSKIVYYLRPYRFVLPLTFLLDIFGGWRKNDILEKNFPERKRFDNTFTDDLLLMDEKERISADNCIDHTLVFLDLEVRIQRRTTAFLGGGFLAHMLGLTNDHNGIDIFIERNHEVYAWVTQAYDSTTDAHLPREERSLYGRNIWLRKSEHHPIFDHNQYKFDSSSWMIFRNHKKVLAKIDSIYTLNITHPIVQHWTAKYGEKNLPRIIFYQTCLKLHNYNILKLISGFDLPINRNALVLSRASAYHLRRDVLKKLYGEENIEKNVNTLSFVHNWPIDEFRDIDRIKRKVNDFSYEIVPEIRGEQYRKHRNFDDWRNIYAFLKHRRQHIVLIKFPFDTMPNCNFAEGDIQRTDRVAKYISRVASVDYTGDRALPLEVYPLKYLAYWQLI